MAKAFITSIDQIYKDGDGTFRFQFTGTLVGADVPTGSKLVSSTITVDANTTLASLGSSIAAEVRAQATRAGITVAANNVFLPTYQQG
jgi:hypothetical protein